MKKNRLIVPVILLLLLAFSALLFFSFPLVVYVYPSAAEDYSSRYSHPGCLNRGYFLLARSDREVSLLEKIKKASIYIYTPYSESEGGEKYASYVIIKDGEECFLPLSGDDMYSSFLSLFEREDIALVYDELSRESASLYVSLSSSFPRLGSITYSERVSVVNEERLIRESGEYYAIIILDPSLSSSLYRKTSSRVVMREPCAVAAVTLESVISLHYDWDRMIRNALSSDSFTPYYTFSVLH